ncbi:MAG TPA: AAA family ATPase [Acidobacteriaceae bacterium]|jgi:predicted ATPase/DNA-binding winged helix-turn-helix (wHTH) protein|nr:AAA family ATPase [Acidobacteriaceae bacterium]
MKRFAGFKLDTRNECLWRGGVQVTLPPKPYLVLRYLVEHPGRLIPHDELLDALWPETWVQPQVLRTYVLELRKLLGDDAGQPRFIQTMTKRGYCFVAAVSDDSEEGGRIVGVVETEGGGRPLAGRVEEMGRLEAALAGAARGQRQILFVSGEAGIGKTTLVDALCRGSAMRIAAQVARGQCVEGFGGRDEYYPVTEALREMCLCAEGEAACAALARLAPAWLAGLGGAPAMHAPPVLATERKPGDLCAALEAMAAERPLLLVLEDVQWADEATLHLVSALARRRAAAQLMVLATCGSGHSAGSQTGPPTGKVAGEEEGRRAGGGESAVKALKQNLLMRQLGTEIALGPLTRAEVAALLACELKEEALPAGLAGFVHQRSEGNPLFAIAIAEHLVARRFLVRAEKAWRVRGELAEAEADVPERLAQMIEVEMEGLTAEEQRILGAGSVMGIAFPAWAVAAALEEDVARVEETCDELARRVHFLERAGEDELPDGTRSEFYVFVHGLYREALYQRQAAGRRAQWHVRIADRLAGLFRGRETAVAQERSLHYEAAGDWRQASAALCDAARYARERGATAEGRHLAEQALRVAEHLEGEERAEAEAAIRAALTETGTGAARSGERRAV